MGADRIGYQLEKAGIGPVPGQRKRRRSDYRRWERARPMELWQMDVIGGFHLADGTELKAVSGIDDSSRFGVSAMLVPRATAKPVCEALLAALRRWGVPEQILTGIQWQGLHWQVRPGRIQRGGVVRPDLR